MDTNAVINEGEKSFQHALDHLSAEFAKLNTGRASGAYVEHLKIDSYGALQPLKNVASISVPDATTIMIQPWDKSMLHPIEKAIHDSGLGVSPTNNGSAVILNMPPLTEERRKDLAKIVHKLAEDAKIAIRNARQNVNGKVKTMHKDNDITEDEWHRAEKHLQEKVDEYNKKVEELAKAKEQDIMTV